MCLLAICISSSEKLSIQVICQYFKWSCLFCCCWDWRVLLYWRSWRVLLYVFWILSSYQIYDLQTFSPILCFACFHSVDNCLLMHKVFVFTKSSLFILSFVSSACGAISEKSLPSPISWRFFSIFSSQSFTVCKWVNEFTQSCPTLCNPIDCSLPGSSVHGIFQARILEWVAI